MDRGWGGVDDSGRFYVEAAGYVTVCDVTPIYGFEIIFFIQGPEMSFTITERMRKSDVNGNFLIL